ncbi:hypothetical protein ABPG72_011136 [Tetrahymena utriculariae]
MLLLIFLRQIFILKVIFRQEQCILFFDIKKLKLKLKNILHLLLSDKGQYSIILFQSTNVGTPRSYLAIRGFDQIYIQQIRQLRLLSKLLFIFVVSQLLNMLLYLIAQIVSLLYHFMNLKVIFFNLAAYKLKDSTFYCCNHIAFSFFDLFSFNFNTINFKSSGIILKFCILNNKKY